MKNDLNNLPQYSSNLQQRLLTIFFFLWGKEPEGKYFRLCGPRGKNEDII